MTKRSRPYGASGTQLTIDGHEEAMGGRRFGSRAPVAQCAGQGDLFAAPAEPLKPPGECDGQLSIEASLGLTRREREMVARREAERLAAPTEEERIRHAYGELLARREAERLAAVDREPDYGADRCPGCDMPGDPYPGSRNRTFCHVCGLRIIANADGRPAAHPTRAALVRQHGEDAVRRAHYYRSDR